MSRIPLLNQTKPLSDADRQLVLEAVKITAKRNKHRRIARFTRDEVCKIRAEYIRPGKTTQRQLASKYNCSLSTINALLHGYNAYTGA